MRQTTMTDTVMVDVCLFCGEASCWCGQDPLKVICVSGSDVTSAYISAIKIENDAATTVSVYVQTKATGKRTYLAYRHALPRHNILLLDLGVTLRPGDYLYVDADKRVKVTARPEYM